MRRWRRQHDGPPIVASVIGIYGGTFDPVHVGHLRTALEIRAVLNLPVIRFVPAGQPPHRERPRADAATRVRMLRAATAEVPAFEVDDRELSRQGPSYTVDTLISLREESPERTLVLIMGMDAFLGLPTWSRWQTVFELAHVAVAHRPGATLPGTGVAGELLAARASSAPAALQAGAGRIFVHPVTALDISASAIRAGLASGVDPRYLVPAPVREILLQTACYSEAGADSAQLRGGSE